MTERVNSSFSPPSLLLSVSFLCAYALVRVLSSSFRCLFCGFLSHSRFLLCFDFCFFLLSLHVFLLCLFLSLKREFYQRWVDSHSYPQEGILLASYRYTEGRLERCSRPEWESQRHGSPVVYNCLAQFKSIRYESDSVLGFGLIISFSRGSFFLSLLLSRLFPF